MLKRRRQAIVKLYTEDKLSMMQIAQKLHLSTSGVRYYLEIAGVERRSSSEAITCLHITKFKKRQFVLKDGLTDMEEKIKIAGTMLYWGEGAKSGNTVKFVNSDPEMIKLFLTFLRVVCGISEERLKALVHMYPDQDKNILEIFWSRVANIPRLRFYKSHIHQGRAGTYKNKSLYGTLALNYSDKKLLKTILQWAEEYKKRMIS